MLLTSTSFSTATLRGLPDLRGFGCQPPPLAMHTLRGLPDLRGIGRLLSSPDFLVT